MDAIALSKDGLTVGAHRSVLRLATSEGIYGEHTESGAAYSSLTKSPVTLLVVPPHLVGHSCVDVFRLNEYDRL